MSPLASSPSLSRFHWVDKNHFYLLLTVQLDRRKLLLSHRSSKSYVDLCAVVSSPCSFPLLHLTLSLRRKRWGRESRITNPPFCVLRIYWCLRVRIWRYSLSAGNAVFNLRITCRPSAGQPSTSRQSCPTVFLTVNAPTGFHSLKPHFVGMVSEIATLIPFWFFFCFN